MMRYISFFLIALLLSGCVSQKSLKKTFQSENAYNIASLQNKINAKILVYKQKLDKRNPQGFHPLKSSYIQKNIQNETNPEKFLHYGYTIFDNPAKYLQHAFKDETVYKNDYLIMGLYAMVYDAFKMDKKHSLTALHYDITQLQKLHKNLQVLKWKIKTATDAKGSYHFLTWQNNWQVELLKKWDKDEAAYDQIKELEYIKNKKESIFDISNTSFDTTLEAMILYTALAIEYGGGKANDLTTSLLKSFILF